MPVNSDNISFPRAPKRAGREGERNERLAKLITREMGVQIPHSLGTEVSKKGIVWQSPKKGRGDFAGVVSAA
jgi:hypothetical protein